MIDRMVGAMLIVWIFSVYGTINSFGYGRCSQPSTVLGKKTDCSCSEVARIVTSCGAGIKIRDYESCYGGFEEGYEVCLNRRQPVGSRWDCTATVTWSKIASCTARAAVCAVACGSSVAHAGVLCAACVAEYIVSCTGCGFIVCAKTNVSIVTRAKKTVMTGACPKVVNTIQ